MSIGTDHLNSCTKDDCIDCDQYLEFCMTCDCCGMWGQKDSGGWFIGERGVYCSRECLLECNETELNTDQESEHERATN